MSNNLSLKNKKILITRPEGLANSLINRINELGGVAQHYPVIRISDVEDSKSLTAIINDLSNFDLAIFISPSAVIKSLEKISSLPSHLQLAVIGRSTQAMVNKYGLHAKIVPEGFNTESLLLHPALQENNIADKSIVIFRGIGGRDLLADSLQQRGAKVIYAETYQRSINPLPSLSINELNNLDILTVTSNEGLQNFFDLADESIKESLLSLPLIVPGDRAYKLASLLGFNSIIQADNASDDACLQALIQFFSC